MSAMGNFPALMPTYKPSDLTFEYGEGAYLFTANGQRYLDFASGIAVTALGHCHPHLVRALTEQAGRLWHTSNAFQIPGQQRLAERLVAASFADSVFFTNSGVEAMECGIKLLRRHFDRDGAPHRYRVITFEGAFHGRSLATLAAGGNPKYLEGYDPPVDGFDQVAFGDLAAVEAAIGPDSAAILIEPVQGEGGVRVASAEFLQGLRALADRHGLLLFFDEIQCGMGRTGRLFAHEWAAVAPDIMAVAKGLGGGFPVGACLATAAVAASFQPGSHGTTFGGNPLAMAVGNAVLDIIVENGFLAQVEKMGVHLQEGLRRVKEKYPQIISDVRGVGLMAGIQPRQPNTEMIDALRGRGLLSVGASDNVVRLLPPLIIEATQIDTAMEVLEDTCQSMATAAA